MQSWKNGEGGTAQGDLPLELALGIEENEMAVTGVVDSDTSIVQDGEDDGGSGVPPELSGTFAHPPELAQQIPLEVDDRDARRLGIEHVQVARSVEGHVTNPAESVPLTALKGSHPVQLFEVGIQPAVLRGQFDDLLGGQGLGARRQQTCRGECTRDLRPRTSGSVHSLSLLGLFISTLVMVGLTLPGLRTPRMARWLFSGQPSRPLAASLVVAPLHLFNSFRTGFVQSAMPQAP